jgi:hypothetical protein
MNAGQTVFRQLLQFLPRHEFNLCTRRYRDRLDNWGIQVRPPIIGPASQFERWGLKYALYHQVHHDLCFAWNRKCVDAVA